MPETSKRAVFSLSEKDPQFAVFAQALMENGWTIYATPATHKFLLRNTRLRRKRAFLRPVEDITKLPSYQHASLTLAPRIHAALQCPGDNARVGKREVRRISLLCIDLTSPQQLKNVDVGGPALIRSALKGHRIIITKCAQIEEVMNALCEGKIVPDKISQKLREDALEKLIADMAEVSTIVSPGVFEVRTFKR